MSYKDFLKILGNVQRRYFKQEIVTFLIHGLGFMTKWL